MPSAPIESSTTVSDFYLPSPEVWEFTMSELIEANDMTDLKDESFVAVGQ